MCEHKKVEMIESAIEELKIQHREEKEKTKSMLKDMYLNKCSTFGEGCIVRDIYSKLGYGNIREDIR